MNTTTVIIGANGFLGRYLCRHFARNGREVVAIGRNKKGWSGDGMFLEWNGKSQGPWAYALEGAELVINLSGRSVNCRYTSENRDSIMSSRVESTEAVGEAIAGCRVPPKLWINASTATWYRHAEDKSQDEGGCHCLGHTDHATPPTVFPIHRSTICLRALRINLLRNTKIRCQMMEPIGTSAETQYQR